jgi:hypothetical protein
MAGAATTMVRYQNASLYKIDHQCRESLVVSCAATMPQKHAVPCGVDQFIISVNALITTRKTAICRGFLPSWTPGIRVAPESAVKSGHCHIQIQPHRAKPGQYRFVERNNYSLSSSASRGSSEWQLSFNLRLIVENHVQ